ncbi:hypothetical protein, partial [Klebsiella pneumoniae]
MMNNIVRTGPGGMMVGGDGVVRIGYAGKQIGTVAFTEASVIGLGDIASVVARASGPVMIAMMAGDLAIRGLQRCMESGTGWCKRAPANPSEGDDHFDGAVWTYASIVSVSGDSPAAVC